MCVAVIPLLAKVGDRKSGHKINKTALRLCDKRVPVRKEKNIFHPSMLKKNVAKRHNGSGLAGAGCHNEQSLAAVFLIKSAADRLYCALLIVSSGDIFIHVHIFKACPSGAKVEKLFKVAP